MYQRGRPQPLDAQMQSRCNEDLHFDSTAQTWTLREGVKMAKKKNIKVGTISGIDVLRQTRPPQDIPFRMGSYTDKRKKREKN